MFDIDVERCTCGGKIKLVAVIEEPVIEKILKRIGLDPRLPPIAPARKRAEFVGCAAGRAVWVLRGNDRAERKLRVVDRPCRAGIHRDLCKRCV